MLQQVLQWHHMVSAKVPLDTLQDLELNTLGEGLFHVASWIVTVVGVFAVATAYHARTTAGGGRTNVVEGVVNHHLLGLHHGRPGPDAFLYDVAFLLWGTAMLVAGTWLVRSASRATDPMAGTT